MGEAKNIIVKPISARDANAIVKAIHYSGKVVNNSQLHLGVFLNGKCGGAMQFGPSTDKRKIQGIVKGTLWNEFIELNRMAFADWLPRNSESRALGYAFRWIKKTYPHLKWVISFADGTQCGDGTIYRASGFHLISIKKNTSIIKMSDGSVGAKITFNKGKHILKTGAATAPKGSYLIPGFQLKYIYFLDKYAMKNLSVPVIPFSEIEKCGAGMYKGVSKHSARSIDSDAPGFQPGQDGANPIRALIEN